MLHELTGSTVALTEGQSIGLYPTGQIVILSQPPSFLFWDEFFHIGVTLRSLEGNTARTGGFVELKAELVQGSRGESTTIREYGILSSVSDAAELVVEGERIMIPLLDPADTAGKETITFIRCKIQQRRASSDNVLLIRISAMIESPFILASSTTPPISLPETSWAPTYTSNMTMITASLQVVAEDWPEVWYKDEGGRDKCIQVAVRLVDKENQIVLSRCFQLHLTLVYDNDTRSPIMRQDKLRLLGPRKNYIDPETGSAVLLFRIDDVSKNHQGLGFMIRVDAESSIDDVAPAYSPPISVRSKRNKRSRDMTPVDVVESPAAVDMSSSFSFSPTRSHGSSDVTAVQHALKEVFEWSHEIVQSLHGLRWSVLGYTQLSDGSFDYNQPYHSMPNPNEFISKTVFMYNNQIQHHLLSLQSFLDSMHVSTVGRSKTNVRQSIPIISGITSTTNSSHQAQLSIPYRLPLNPELINPSQILPSTITTQQQFITPRSLSRILQQPSPQHQLALPTITPMTSTANKINNYLPQYAHEMNIHLDTEAHCNIHIHFILAKLFKSIGTGKVLGFPAFDNTKTLLGFYVESDRKLGSGTFIPLENFEEFGPNQVSHATLILEQYMEKNSQAVHDITHYESLASMIDHALVYQWTKDLNSEKESKNSSTILHYDINYL